MEFTLLWAAISAVVALWAGTRIWGEDVSENAFDRLLASAIVGLATGRLAAMLAQGVNPLTNPLESIVIRGGVSTPAATAGALGWLIWTSRRDLSTIDALAPASLLGLAGWHAGCLWRGACLGSASDLPWAWSSPTSDITRHPVEIYAALALLIAAFVVAGSSRRTFVRLGVALSLAGLVRLGTEPMRPSISGGPVGWYLLALIVGVGLALWGHRGVEWLDSRRPT